ncbi:hypothetical protein Tco_0964782, partial [Tanacetum coccineum]
MVLNRDNVNVDLNKENTSRVLSLMSSQNLMEDDGLDLRLSLSNGDDKEDVDENENVGLKVLVNKRKSMGNGQVNDLKEAKSGLLKRKKVKLDRGVSEGRDASKKSVDLSGLKHSKKKVVSSSSSKKVEMSKSDLELLSNKRHILDLIYICSHLHNLQPSISTGIITTTAIAWVCVSLVLKLRGKSKVRFTF